MEELKQFKIYIRKQGGDTWYAAISINGKKVLLHRYLMGMHEEEYSIKKVVDHLMIEYRISECVNIRTI